MAQLQADGGAALAVHKINHPFQRCLLGCTPQAGAARGDAPLGARAGHLHHHQRGATQGAGTQVHQVKVLHQTIDRAVGGHGGDHNAVLQGQAAHRQRQQHGCYRFTAGQPGFKAAQPGGVAQAQVFVADALRAGQQRIGKLLDGHAGVARDVLKPLGRIARRVLNLEHLDTSPRLVALQHRQQVATCHQLVGAGGELIDQVDRVFDRQLGAAANRKVRGVGRVPHQHQRHRAAGQRQLVHPGVADHTRKLDPLGRAAQVQGIADQRLAVQVLGKQALTEGYALLLAHGRQAVRLPDRLRRLDNEGGGVLVKFVGMCLKPAVLGLLKSKGECIEGFVRAQPDKTAVAGVDIGLEHLGIAAADSAVQTVAGNHQISRVLLRQRLVVRHIDLKHQFHTQRQAAVLQDVEQVLAPYAAKTVAGGAHAAALEKHLDVVPVVERIANQPAGDRVGRAHVVQGLVRQHHAPSKGVKGLVALRHGDAVGGVLQLHEQRKIQTGGTPAYAQNIHEAIV